MRITPFNQKRHSPSRSYPEGLLEKVGDSQQANQSTIPDHSIARFARVLDTSSLWSYKEILQFH